MYKYRMAPRKISMSDMVSRKLKFIKATTRRYLLVTRGYLRGVWTREYPLRRVARAYKNVHANGCFNYNE